MSSWGTGSLCWPVLARLLPGQLNPLGFVAAPDGVPRLDCWWVVVALVRALPQWVGERPLRVVADAYFRKASCLNSLVAAGITVISRLRKDAVGWDHPAPVVGTRPRDRPRKTGRIWTLARLLAVEPVTELTVVIDGKEARVCVVWRDVWRRDLTSTVRVVAIATKGTPILLVSPDSTLSPAVMIQRYAARFSLELTLRDLKPYMGVGDYQCQRLLAIHRFGHLALTACCLWRLTLLQEQSAPWLTAAHSTAAGALTPLGFQRLHHAWRRRVRQRIFTASAAAADSQKTEARDEQIVRIVA